jgi:hypothetical protein
MNTLPPDPYEPTAPQPSIFSPTQQMPQSGELLQYSFIQQTLDVPVQHRLVLLYRQHIIRLLLASSVESALNACALTSCEWPIKCVTGCTAAKSGIDEPG